MPRHICAGRRDLSLAAGSAPRLRHIGGGLADLSAAPRSIRPDHRLAGKRHSMRARSLPVAPRAHPDYRLAGKKHPMRARSRPVRLAWRPVAGRMKFDVTVTVSPPGSDLVNIPNPISLAGCGIP